MVHAHLVAASIAALVWYLRHRPTARQEQGATLEQLRHLAGPGTGLAITAGLDSLTINGTDVPIDLPGALALNEHLLLQGVRHVELAAPLDDDRVLSLCAVLAAFPGTFEDFAEVQRAAGAGPGLTLSEAPSELTFERYVPVAPLLPDPGLRAPVERDDFVILAEEGGLVHLPAFDELAELEAQDRVRADRLAVEPTGAPTQDPLAVRLAEVVERGRRAAETEHWDGLLQSALEILEIEAEAPTEAFTKAIRLELRRMLPRAQLYEIARLASQGGRKQEALAILRKVGADSTEVLMDLLVEAMSLGERRGYYTAITHMSDGHDVIVAHLSHPVWYVVRNAAELCGEMDLERAVPELARQAGHQDERVRRSVAGALAKIGAPQAVDPLRRLLADPVAAVRLRIVTALNPHRARGMVIPLATQLGRETEADVLAGIAQALGRIGTPDAIQALAGYAQSDRRLLGRGGRPVEFKVLAVEGLALAGPGAEAPLRGLAKDGEGPVQEAARAALERRAG